MRGIIAFSLLLLMVSCAPGEDQSLVKYQLNTADKAEYQGAAWEPLLNESALWARKEPVKFAVIHIDIGTYANEIRALRDSKTYLSGKDIGAHFVIGREKDEVSQLAMMKYAVSGSGGTWNEQGISIFIANGDGHGKAYADTTQDQYATLAKLCKFILATHKLEETSASLKLYNSSSGFSTTTLLDKIKALPAPTVTPVDNGDDGGDNDPDPATTDPDGGAASGAKLTGYVYRTGTDIAVVNATVKLGTLLTTKVKTDGSFTMTGIPGGNYTLTLDKTGYDPTEKDLELVAGEAITRIFYMTPQPGADLDEIDDTSSDLGTETDASADSSDDNAAPGADDGMFDEEDPDSVNGTGTSKTSGGLDSADTTADSSTPQNSGSGLPTVPVSGGDTSSDTNATSKKSSGCGLMTVSSASEHMLPTLLLCLALWLAYAVRSIRLRHHLKGSRY